MPIWVHRLLGTVLQVAGFFGGGFIGICMGSLLFMAAAAAPKEGPAVGGALYLLIMAVGAAFFFGGASLGRSLSYELFVRHVSARCPQCGGRTYLHSENATSVRYRCRSCEHVYVGASWEE